MKEETTEKKKTGRHGSKRRPNRVEICFSDTEYSRVKELAEEANAVSLPEFVRLIVMFRGMVTAALTPEDRKLISDLGKMGTNLWEIRKDLMRHGTDKQLLADLESMYQDFKKIKDYYKEINNIK